MTLEPTDDLSSAQTVTKISEQSQKEFVNTQNNPTDLPDKENLTKPPSPEENGNDWSFSLTQYEDYFDSQSSEKNKENQSTEEGKSEKSDCDSVAAIATRDSPERSPKPGCSKDLDGPNNHPKAKQQEKGRFNCQNCEESLGVEEIMHHQCGEKPFTCSVCDKKFSYEKDFDEHQKIHKEKLFE